MGETDIVVSGDEMPSWLLPGEGGFISFMVPQELYDNFVGVAICAVLGLDDRVKNGFSCSVRIFINGEPVHALTKVFRSLESDSVWLHCKDRRNLLIVYSHLRNAWSHFNVRIRLSDGILKSRRCRPLCKQREDDLKVVP